MTPRRGRYLTATVVCLSAFALSAPAAHSARVRTFDDPAGTDPNRSELLRAGVTTLTHGKPAKAKTTRREPTLSDETGLVVTIDDISPATLTPGAMLEMSGTLTNGADHTWFNAKAYLEMSVEPATTKGAIDDFALTEDASVGERVVDFGYFDELGAVRPGESTSYDLRIPYKLLPASGAAGVYHVGVSVLTQEEAEGGDRDLNADARADTLLPLLRDASPPEKATSLTTLLPVTAPVARFADGTFVDDQLAKDLDFGGRLSNIVEFASQAPAGSLDLIVDPAVLDAAQAMAGGYEVQSLADARAEIPPEPGVGQVAAADWLNRFGAVADNQEVSLMPWANPDSSALTEARIPGVVGSAVRASRRFAFANGYSTTVVDWQNNGASTRRGLVAANAAGATIHVVSQATLTELPPEDDNGYPPDLVSVTTGPGPLSVVVTRSEVAGQTITPTTTGVELRQDVLSEAVIRAISSTEAPSSVVGLPFHWNPGPESAGLDLATAFDSPVVRSTSLAIVNAGIPLPYAGPIEVTTNTPGLSAGLLVAIDRLGRTGRTYTDLLTDNRQTAARFDEQLASSGSSSWQWRPRRGEAITRRTTASLSTQLSRVTVTGPEFVALSSEAGRFPLSVTNGLESSVTVNVNVTAVNAALTFDQLEPIVLDPGQHLDIMVEGKAAGSGVTVVRARLATTSDRPFGQAWTFDIRATRIGLAIWILMGVLGAALFSGAAIRIIQRFRGGGFTPRGEAS